jgi:predicted Zn-dependent protease
VSVCTTARRPGARNAGDAATLPRVALIAVVAVATAFAHVLGAKPFVPAGDDVVLEHLPEKADPSLRDLKRMRAALAANPRSLEMAVPVARRALEAARESGDPRFVGQAQAALAPWWSGDDAPPAALLVRATIKQSQHDFAGALADLDRLLAARPSSAQARLTRATVLGVLGRYADARRDCAGLARRASAIVVAGCDAVPASLSGAAASAYAALASALADGGGDAGVREWALTLAAEIAARRGHPVAAERHFREALLLDPRDPYLKGAYADFLLDADRPHDVLPLLADDVRNDGLLLRLALAEARLADRREAFARHREALAARFDAARRRGDATHRREEARFRLALEHDAAGALRLARDNFAVQREPADVRILIDAARAARDAGALAVASAWVAQNGIEDVAIGAALGGAR